MYLPIAEGALNPFLSWRGGDLFSYWQDKKTGDPSTRMRAVLPLPHPILLFHGEKASDEGRFNALLIICKDVRLLPIYYRYIGSLRIRLCNTPRKSSLVERWNLLKRRRDLVIFRFVNCRESIDFLIMSL